jgi:molybdopterin synthase sulfur carrier subunit
MQENIHTIHLWGALRPHAEGATIVTLEARTIRELFKNLSETYPAMEPHIKRGIAVVIDGQIYRDEWDKTLEQGTEIYLMPRLAGG